MNPDPLTPGSFRASLSLPETTLAELGDLLPHGLVDGATLHRTFRLRRPTMGLQKQVGALRSDAAAARRPGTMFLRFLALVVESIGSVDVGALKAGPAEELLGRLTVGDTLYLGFAWQRARSPRGMPLGAIDCGGCGQSLSAVRVDVGTLATTHLPVDLAAADLPRAEVALWEPLPRSAGAPVDSVTVRSPAWGLAFGRLGVEGFRNGAAMQSRTFAAAIVGARAGGQELAGVSEAQLDELLPDDVRLLDDAIASVTPTLDLTVEVACPHCGAVNRDKLDWQTEGFFRAS